MSLDVASCSPGLGGGGQTGPQSGTTSLASFPLGPAGSGLGASLQLPVSKPARLRVCTPASLTSSVVSVAAPRALSWDALQLGGRWPLRDSQVASALCEQTSVLGLGGLGEHRGPRRGAGGAICASFSAWQSCWLCVLPCLLCPLILSCEFIAGFQRDVSSPLYKCVFSSVPSLSCVRLFATPWTAARQASLSITNSWSLFKLMSMELVMPPNHLILCRPPSPPTFNLCQHQGLFQWPSGGQRIGASASTSVLPMNIQDWFPLGWTGWISLLSKGLLRVFSNTTVQKHQFLCAQLSL